MNRDTDRDASRPAELLPGTRLEEYELVAVSGCDPPSAVLGRGGFGVVYLIRDINLPERLLALKVAHHGAAHDGEHAPLEATLLSRLAHDAIPRVFRLLRLPGRVGLVMEYAEGVTLLELARREASEEHAGIREEYLGSLLRAVGDAARGLAHMHSRGVMHYDVQPANVVWDPVSRRGRLIDLGLAAQGSQPPLGGTAGFTDPSPFDNSCPAARDVWSLGALLYYGVRRQPPPVNVDEENPWCGSLAAGGGLAALNGLIDQCLRSLPAARPTAAVVAAELDAIAAAVVPPHNLPALRRAWFGRDTDLATAKAILARDRRLCVVGPGGMGKTRLVSELARAVLGQYRAVVYVDLDRDKDRPVAEVTQGQVIAVAGTGAQMVQRACPNGERRVLAFLDNAESRSSDEEVAAICDFIDESEGWDFIVASRSALRRLATSELTLPPLKGNPTQDPALQLLVDRLGPWAPAAPQLNSERDFLQRLADALNRTPLFMELAALSVGAAGGYAIWREKLEQALNSDNPDAGIDNGVSSEFPGRQRQIDAIIGDCAAVQQGPSRALLMRLQLLTSDHVQVRFWSRWVHEICNWYGDLGTREEVDTYLDYLARCGWVERDGAQTCVFNRAMILTAARKLFQESDEAVRSRTLSLSQVRGAISVARLSWWDAPARPRRNTPAGADLDLLSWAVSGTWSDERLKGADTVDRILIRLQESYYFGYAVVCRVGEQALRSNDNGRSSP